METLLGTGTTQTTSHKLAPADGLENLGANLTEEQLRKLKEIVGAGAGTEDVANALSSQRGLADLLKQYSQGGFMPNSQDLASARSFTDSIYAPQQEAMKQGFSDQLTQANRDAATLGRDINDPILRAKLAQSQSREQAILDANKTASFVQQAQQMPLQRLGFASDLSNVYSSLSNQAFSNRQALLSLGNTVQQQGRSFRMGTATTTTNQNTDNGLLGLAAGVSGVAGFGLSGVNGIKSLMGAFGGSGTPSPVPSQQPKVNGGMMPWGG